MPTRAPWITVAVVCAAEILSMTPFSMFLALQPRLQDAWTLSNTASGWISSAYFTGYMLAVPVLGWALWRTFVSRDWRYATVLTGYAAALLPWFVTLDRQMYYFYAVALAPFFVMAIALILGEILGTVKDSAERRGTGLLAVCLYVGLVVANFVWLWPILTAMPITPEMWQRELWLPSWR
jgi:dolichyl-phosphate-mannose--protein O-mannosyl transferase